MIKRNLNILVIAIGITIFGFLMDSDVKEPITIMRFIEFFAMIGIIFIISFVISNLFRFTKNRINLLRS
ncbi:membrane protein YdbS with pleckstrin-like domain [Flavobacterium sp. PL11]|nr:membrane protein YdbS with pleckstrin-like domain [Flavobacterium sp. PL11]